MKKIALFLCVILCGCKSVSYHDFIPTVQPNANLLPAMNIDIDEKSLTAAYPARKVSEYDNDGRLIDMWQRDDVRVGDVRNIFEKEVKENISELYGSKKGYITLKLGYYDRDITSWYSVPAAFTLGTVYLVGFPYRGERQTLEVIVEVQNNKREVIKRYTEMVSNEAYVALYWGYEQDKLSRKIGADNIKQALEKIRYRINADAPEIKKALN